MKKDDRTAPRPRVAPGPDPHDQLGPFEACIPTKVAPNAAVASIKLRFGGDRGGKPKLTAIAIVPLR